MLQMKTEMTNIWKYKVGNNANIANVASLWKTRLAVNLCWTKTFEEHIGMTVIFTDFQKLSKSACDIRLYLKNIWFKN